MEKTIETESRSVPSQTSVYEVDPSGQDLIDFDLQKDQLDFVDHSVHALIVGTLPDGTAVIVNPWSDSFQYQRIIGVGWKEFEMDNITPVSNEHLRQDIGAVISWEKGIGEKDPSTVYIRSHQYGVHERVENFDPSTQKLNFIYVGTRERLTVQETSKGLLILFKPTNQSFLLAGIQKSDLRGHNLEFHHDQVMEDNLELPFGFSELDVSLVSREGLFTPSAPNGNSTDGYQERNGLNIGPNNHINDAKVESNSHHSHHSDANRQSTVDEQAARFSTVGLDESLEAVVSGNLFWQGMSGEFTLTNKGKSDLNDWQLSFNTPHHSFSSGGGEFFESIDDNGNNFIVLKPKAWNKTIAAGDSLTISFNAESVGLENSGNLTNEMFFNLDQVESFSLDTFNSVDDIEQPLTTGHLDQDKASDVTSDSDLSDFDREVVETMSQPSAQITSEDNLDLDASEIPAQSLEENLAEDLLAKEDAPINNTPSQERKRVVGYFEGWGIYGRDFRVADINAEKLTHINYSFFDVKSDGSIVFSDPWADIEKRFTSSEPDDLITRQFSERAWSELDQDRKDSYMLGLDFSVEVNQDNSISVTGIPDSWNQNNDYYGNLNQLRLLKQLYPDVELGFALGGWTMSDEFSEAVNDVNRSNFVDSIINKLSKYKFFSVIDFDWEYPGGGGLDGNIVSASDGDNFALMLKELREELDKFEIHTGREIDISVATAGGADKLLNLNLEGIDSFVDFYNVMSYDYHGGWEAKTGHQAAMTGDEKGYDILTSINQFQKAGISTTKLNLGVPLYARSWGDVEAGSSFGYQEHGNANQAKGSFEAGTYDYKDILTGVDQGTYDVIWDDNSKAAYTYDDVDKVWSSTETTATVAGKAAYVQLAELGGMMFWALSSDDQNDQSLISTSYDILNSHKTAQDFIDESTPFNHVIGGNSQFSLQDFTSLA